MSSGSPQAAVRIHAWRNENTNTWIGSAGRERPWERGWDRGNVWTLVLPVQRVCMDFCSLSANE